LLKETFSQTADCKKLSIYSQPDSSFFTTKLPQPISGDQGNSLFSIIGAQNKYETSMLSREVIVLATVISLEYWNIGILGCRKQTFPSFHHSIIPWFILSSK
jgi:hypothetical protein